MNNYLIKKFLSSIPEDFQNQKVREQIGYRTGILGLIINSILFFIKIIIGSISSSISITADAFNNLSDAGSSIITIIGFKLSNKPADKDHPYGHGRIEYISALFVAFMVMLVGFQFAKSSVDKIFNPMPIAFSIPSIIIIILSIILKLYLGIFNTKLGRLIDSQTLKAAGADAFGDVITTSVIVLSIIGSLFIDYPLDGYIGLLVSLIILYAGFSLVRDTISPLIGEGPNKALVNSIREAVLSYDYINGVHDLIIHNYGPGKTMAYIHAEFPANINIVEIHNTIDQAEREISKKLNIELVIHMDPISIETKDVRSTRKELEDIIKNYPIIKSYHDFRIIGKGSSKNIIFDLIIDGNLIDSNTTKEKLEQAIREDMKKIHSDYKLTFTIDLEYI